jgi:hypothetical protein
MQMDFALGKHDDQMTRKQGEKAHLAHDSNDGLSPQPAGYSQFLATPFPSLVPPR